MCPKSKLHYTHSTSFIQPPLGIGILQMPLTFHHITVYTVFRTWKGGLSNWGLEDESSYSLTSQLWQRRSPQFSHPGPRKWVIWVVTVWPSSWAVVAQAQNPRADLPFEGSFCFLASFFRLGQSGHFISCPGVLGCGEWVWVRPSPTHHFSFKGGSYHVFTWTCINCRAAWWCGG